MKKHYLIGFTLFIVGIIGLLFCSFLDRTQDSGQNYKKTWTLSEDQLNSLHIASQKNVALAIKQTDSKQTSISIHGNLSRREIEQLKGIQPKQNSFSLQVGTKHTWLEKWHQPNYGIQKITIQIPKSASTKHLKLDLQEGNIYLDNIRGENASISLNKGSIKAVNVSFKTAKVDTDSTQTDLTKWHGNLLLFAKTGNQILKDSTGRFTLQNQDGMSQVHRFKGKSGKILNLSGKIITTEVNVEQLNVNSTEGTAIIEGLKGDLLLSTLKGKSVLRNNIGKQFVRSQSGDIIVAQAKLGKNMDIESNSGLIKLTLPSEYHQKKFMLKAPHGKVESDFTWLEKTKSPLVNLQTDSGEIKVLENNDRSN